MLQQQQIELCNLSLTSNYYTYAQSLYGPVRLLPPSQNAVQRAVTPAPSEMVMYASQTGLLISTINFS
jgi:hypothetical protein